MRTLLRLRLCLCLLVFLPLGHVSAQADAFPGFDVVGSELGVTALSPTQVRDIFRGERALWSTGTAVTVVLPSARSSYVDSFAQGVLWMRREMMQRYWIGLVFQGRATPPVNLPTAAEVIAYVERTPGAIAMVPQGTAPRALIVPVR
jgi:ABC-type phosphate transport system substrate-binding protein